MEEGSPSIDPYGVIEASHPLRGQSVLFQGVIDFLQRMEPYQRLPKKIQDSWKSLHLCENGSVAQVFADVGGFVAWFAYIRLSHAAEDGTCFAGKPDCKHMIDTLEQADILAQIEAVTQVSAALSGDQKCKILELRKKMLQPAKMRRTTNSNHTTVSEAPQPSPTPSPDIDRTATDRSPIPARSGFLTDYEQLFVNPALSAARNLFPKPLSDAIGTTPSTTADGGLRAAISMAFPPTGSKDDCQMVIELVDDQVQYFAMKWFGERVEPQNGLRRVVTSGGHLLLPYPRLTLQGIPLNYLEDFGKVVSHAIMKSPRYQDDIKHGRSNMSSVSMVISAEASARAEIYLSLGLFEGIHAKEILFFEC